MEAIQVMKKIWKGSEVGSRYRIEIRCKIMIQRVYLKHVMFNKTTRL